MYSEHLGSVCNLDEGLVCDNKLWTSILKCSFFVVAAAAAACTLLVLLIGRGGCGPCHTSSSSSVVPLQINPPDPPGTSGRVQKIQDHSFGHMFPFAKRFFWTKPGIFDQKQSLGLHSFQAPLNPPPAAAAASRCCLALRRSDLRPWQIFRF